MQAAHCDEAEPKLGIPSRPSRIKWCRWSPKSELCEPGSGTRCWAAPLRTSGPIYRPPPPPAAPQYNFLRPGPSDAPGVGAGRGIRLVAHSSVRGACAEGNAGRAAACGTTARLCHGGGGLSTAALDAASVVEALSATEGAGGRLYIAAAGIAAAAAVLDGEEAG